MTLAELDKNFAFKGITEKNLDWYDRYAPVFDWDGVADLEHFHRLDAAKRDRLPEGILEGYPSTGIRVRFTTDATVIALKAVLWIAADMPHMARTGSHGFDLFMSEQGQPLTFAQYFPTEEDHTLVSGQYLVPGEKKMRTFEINFPLYNGVLEFSLGFSAGAAFGTPAPYSLKDPVVYYGSSITQGACASRPCNCYTQMLTNHFNLRQINLGFSGRAKGEPVMARYIASLPMSVFVMDYDHNADTPEDLAATHEDFFHIVRAANPVLPIILISRPNTDRDPADACARFEVIARTYRNAVAAGDKHVYLVDGRRLFDGDMRVACTVDSCHPSDLGFFRMYEGVRPVMERALEEAEND